MNEQDSLASLAQAESDIIELVETVADLFTKLASENVDKDQIQTHIKDFALFLDSTNTILKSEISKHIQQLPITTNPSKDKLDSQITELLANHVHEQIKDILSFIEKADG